MIEEEYESKILAAALSGIIEHVIRGEVIRDWPNGMGYFTDEGFQELMCFQMPFDPYTFGLMVEATWKTAIVSDEEIGEAMGLYWIWRADGPRVDDEGEVIFDHLGAINGLVTLRNGRMACMVYPISPEFQHWWEMDPDKSMGNTGSEVLGAVKKGMGFW